MTQDVLEATSLSFGEIVHRLSVSRRVVPIAAGAGLVLGIALALLLPKVYLSEATLLPSSEDESSLLGSNLAGLAGTLGIPLTGVSTPESHLFPAILKSERIIRDALATPFGPNRAGAATLYDIVADLGDPEDVRVEKAVEKVREEILRVGLDEETGIVRVTVRMSDPEIANRANEIFLSQLTEYLKHERNARSRENREFVEGRYQEAKAELSRAENALASFRESNRRIGNSPDLMVTEGRLYRAVRVQEEVFLELTGQYELARIEEQKATPVVEILDPPTLHRIPGSPKLPIFAGIGLLAGAFLGSLFAVAFESPGASLRGARHGMRALLGQRLRA
jgi:uncharacterized protein involved in exopolysaccharide biosynthesis